MPRKSGGKARKRLKAARRRYSMQREDAQLAGDIPTTPEGAIRDERAPPSYDVPMPELVRLAIQRGWSVSEEGKRKCVADLVAAIRDPETRESLRIRCFQALILAEKAQREQDGD